MVAGAIADGTEAGRPTSASGRGTAAGRLRIYRRLKWRNRVVAILRWAVPGLGVLLGTALIAQIYLANIAANFGADGISFDRDALIVDTPRFAGVMADGTTYAVSADAAVARLDNPEQIELTGAFIVTRAEDGYEMRAWSDLALLDLSVEEVTMPGLMTTLDSNGVSGEIHGAVVDWPTQTLASSGRAFFVYPDGATVTGDTLVYNGDDGTWLFTNSVYTAPGDGGENGEDEDAQPDAEL